MAKLIFLLENNILDEFAINRERITIGRRPSNDIHIDNLGISGAHAEVVTLGEDSAIIDLDSTNGTLVNNKKISKHMLKNNDVIELGKYQLKYVNQPSGAPVANQGPADGFADTVMMKDAPAEQIEQGPSGQNANHPNPAKETAAQPVINPAAVADMPSANMPYLRVLTGSGQGDEILLNKTMVRIGTAGQQVAVINKRDDGHYISHVSGDDRPLVNGQMIGVQAHLLSDSDTIQLEGVDMEFHSA